MSDDDAIPSRAALFRRLESANRIAGPWVVLQFVLCIAAAWFIDWRRLAESPLLSLFAVTVIVGPYFLTVLRQYALQKKEIGDLKESTRFGEFDKYRLRTLVDDVLQRLDLPPPGPPVYVTADKTLNAGAVHLGLGGFFRSLNGVYLNRQLLHRLTPAELQDIVGHELGHFYRYYLINQRFQSVTILLGSLVGLLVAQTIGLDGYFGVLALSACGSVTWYVSAILYAAHATDVEYLCDDFGAQVHGVVTSINGLLKLGADGEMQSAVHQQELLRRRHSNLHARDIIEAIEAATPYGHTSREELERAVAESLQRTSDRRRRLSVGKFLEFAWAGDESDELEAEMKKLRALQELPRLDWESLLDGSGRIAFNESRIAALVERIEQNPELVLFRLPEEVNPASHVHPPTRNRILYLWKNRREIESSSKSVR